MEIKSYLEHKKKLVDDYLGEYISSRESMHDCPEILFKSMKYSLMAGGKRVRPILSIASYEAIGGESDSILPVATAIELIHTYSLIHDDLPAMDDDDFRRNQPTNHKVFGEAIAILAGDALLTDAFNMIAETDANPATIVKIIKELSYASGPEGMVGGQIVDLEFEGKTAAEDDLLYIHTHKTAALIRASIRIGALMAEPTGAGLKSLTEYGEKIGLAFQVVDDILDVTATKEEMGKTTGADYARGKNTYPSIFGLEESRNIADTLVNDALEALKGLNGRAKPLEEIAKYIISRRN